MTGSITERRWLDENGSSTTVSLRPILKNLLRKTERMEVKVINNQIERSMRELKRMLIREGVFKELKKRRYYHKPSVRLKLKREDAEKTRHKDRKRAMARARAIL
jgi:small subunit ribosomal protein S21